MPSPLRSLRVRNYRLFQCGQLISVSGTWVQRVGQDWLLLSLTHDSAGALGVASGLQFLPLAVLGPWGGLIADRFDKRKLLVVTQLLMATTAATLATLTLTGVVHAWQIFLLSFVLGCTTAFDNPARQAFQSELVGKELLANAVSLSSVTFNLSRLIGPGIGGVLVAAAGPGPAFVANALSYLAVVSMLLAMRPAELHRTERAAAGRRQIREGLRFVVRHPQLRILFIVVFVSGAFAQNWPVLLAPMAKIHFGGGSQQYGYLLIGLAIGSIAGALGTAARGSPAVRQVLLAAGAFGAMQIAASFSPSLIWLCVLLVPTGMCALTFTTSANASVQLAVPDSMRGRVMAGYLVAANIGGPVGAPVLGLISQWWGPPQSLVFSGSALVLSVLLAVALLRRTSPS